MLYLKLCVIPYNLFQAGANCTAGDTKVFRWNLGYEMVNKFELTGGM